MSADMEELLATASSDPAAPADPDQVWAAGRRRRRWMQAGGVATAAASIAVVGLVVVGLNPASSPAPTIDPMAEGPDEADDEGASMEDLGDTAHPGDELPRMETPPPPREEEPVEEEPAEPTEEPVEEVEDTTPTAGPQPDPVAVQAPCAPHEGREDSYIDLVAPVSGQQVGGTIELVGCSNVPEATVRYRVLDSGGGVLADGFTTATCWLDCQGEFRENVAVSASGEVTVQVFWDSPQDGAGEQDMTEVVVTAG
jgi:hypothetical protein